MIEPRYRWVPPRSRSLGKDCADWWRAHGGTLFDWQELVIDGMLGLTDEDRWASANDGLNVARQNGKGVVCQAIEAFFAFELDYPVVMHTAHEFATSLEHQLRLEAVIQDDPELHGRVKDRGGYVHANGQESIRLKSGARIIFKARTSAGGRGYSGDLLVWDEAMIIPTRVVGAQKPMLRASRAPFGQKTIYAGSAVDQEIHEHGIPFALIRERGIAETPGVSWHEWSAPFEHPSEMTMDVLRDRSWWRKANPSMDDGLIAEEYMADEIETMPPRTAAVELGGVGDWPNTSGDNESVFDLGVWKSLADEDSEALAPVWFAFDVSPNRGTAAIAAAGFRADGLFHVELVDYREGTAWLPKRLKHLMRHKPAGFVCDERSPAASLIPAIEDLGLKVERAKTRQMVDACGVIFDAVAQQQLRHWGQEELDSAVKGASRRPLEDAWAWKRSISSVDISPLVAVTLALGKLAAEGTRKSVYEERGMLEFVF